MAEPLTAEQIAQAFHEAFERLSHRRVRSTPAARDTNSWAELPGHYRTQMAVAIQVLLDDGVITGGSVTREDLSHG